jgi:nitroreductase
MSTQSAAPLSAFEAMSTARSMRWFTNDPVDRGLIEQVIWAGTRASSPSNTQAWDFVVVTSPQVRKQLGAAVRATVPAPGSSDLPADPSRRRSILGATNLLNTLEQIPVLIFVCGANNYPPAAPVIEWAYSAIFAAAQNMLVAARALGLGAAFTTIHSRAEDSVRDILGIPADRIIGVTMPLGWPARAFGPVTRKPVTEFIHNDGW